MVAALTTLLLLAARIALIVALGFLVGSWLAGLVRVSLNRTRLDPIVRELITSLVQPTIIVIAALGALGSAGVDLTGAVALLGAAGIGIGLAMKNSLSGIAAGAMLLTIRPFDGGDQVEVAGQTGTLVAFDLLTVTLQGNDGVIITLPNELVFKSPIRNFTRLGLRRIEIQWGLAHTANLAEAIATLQACLSAEERVIDEPKSNVTVADVDLLRIKVMARGWVQSSDLGGARSDLLQAMRAALIEAKVPLADAGTLSTPITD